MPAPLIVLTYWERRHGVELDTAMSQRFMARPEVQELSTMPTRVVIGAIESHKRLIHIIIKARELAAAYTPTEEDNWRPSAFCNETSPVTKLNSPLAAAAARGTASMAASQVRRAGRVRVVMASPQESSQRIADVISWRLKS